MSKAQKQTSRTTRLIVLAAILIVFVPMVLPRIKREMAVWMMDAATASFNSSLRSADAQAEIQDGIDRAIAWTTKAIQLDPANPQPYLKRSGYYELKRDFAAALADCDRASAVAPGVSNPGFQKKINVYQRINDYKSVLRECDEQLKLLAKKLESYSEGHRAHKSLLRTRAELLNTRAYMCALGQIDLDSALSQIDEAISIRRPYWNSKVGSEIGGMSTRSMFLDTKGYILLKQGKSEAAEVEIEAALRDAEVEYQLAVGVLKRQAEMFVDSRFIDEVLSAHKFGLATLYYHRGEVHEALGREERAERDKSLALSMGFVPGSG